MAQWQQHCSSLYHSTSDGFSRTFFKQQLTSNNSASKWEMIIASRHSNGGIVETLAAQAVTVPVWKSKKLASNNQPVLMAK